MLKLCNKLLAIVIVLQNFWASFMYICAIGAFYSLIYWRHILSWKSEIHNHDIQKNIPEDLNPYMNMFTYECLYIAAGCYSSPMLLLILVLNVGDV